jgi:multimeric flavodoxin WrbA
MNVLYISGSPRKNGNTDYLLGKLQAVIGGTLIRLSELRIENCKACKDCRGEGSCLLQDDMQKVIIPKILGCDALVLGSPVYFNNVSSQMKAFIDRTHCLIGLLKNKVGGAVVVGRKYGSEGAITALNGFFLKHEMVIANRGISGVGSNPGDIVDDIESIEAVGKLGKRLVELGSLLTGRN